MVMAHFAVRIKDGGSAPTGSVNETCGKLQFLCSQRFTVDGKAIAQFLADTAFQRGLQRNDKIRFSSEDVTRVAAEVAIVSEIPNSVFAQQPQDGCCITINAFILSK